MDDNALAEALAELRQWRELDRRRDLNIRLARRAGGTPHQIARASGLRPRSIKRILASYRKLRRPPVTG